VTKVTGYTNVTRSRRNKSECKAALRYNKLHHHYMHNMSQPLHTSDPTAVALIYTVLC
jgi:hypothetical protein